jgi:BirA family biotin operon repressor/biotin-[acetyl-CoA-carboxylase] ligase
MIITRAQKHFTPRIFQSLLQTQYIGRYLYHVHETTSTMTLMNDLLEQKKTVANTHKQEYYESLPSGFLVLSDSQTEGKGRKGRSWYSNTTDNLCFSILLRLEQHGNSKVPDIFKLNLAMVVAVVKMCHDIGVTQARIKWPNDVWIPVSTTEPKGEYGHYRKLSGMLVNSIQNGNEIIAICGIGVNVNQSLSDGPMSSIAISLKDILNTTMEKEKILAIICNHLEQLLKLNFEQLLYEYKQYDLLINNEVMVVPSNPNEIPVVAKAIGYSQFGNLIVQSLSDGTNKELVSEEVSIRIAN